MKARLRDSRSLYILGITLRRLVKSRTVLLEDETNEKPPASPTEALPAEEPEPEPDLGLSNKSDRLKSASYYVQM